MDPPEKPDDTDCCNSGCNPCIFDVWEEKLKKHKSNIKDLSLYTNCIKELKYTTFNLKEIIALACNTFIYIFEYANCNDQGIDDLRLCYEPGQHFLIKAYTDYDNDGFTRAYTPIPMENLTQFQFAVIIKLYEPGLMSKFLKRLKVNESTIWRGPYGDFRVNYEHANILLIAQGTGIAPIYAIIKKYLDNEMCESVLKLFFCVHKEVILRDELYELARNWNFSYEIFANECDLVAKYNEVLHKEKLSYEAIVKYCKNLKNEPTSCLICGSKEFEKKMQEYVINCDVMKDNIILF